MIRIFDILSTLAALFVLLAGGYFTVRFRAFYIRHPLRAARLMPLEKGAKQMLLSLGGTVGVGNISGVAMCIMLGGAGAVLWMWVGAFFAMALKYAEIILGMATRKDGRGGAPYYIKEAIGYLAAVLFALLLIADCIMMGGMIQSSAISEAAHTAFGLSPLVCGVIVSLLAAAVFFFKVDCFKLSAYVVPAMSVGYLLAAAAVLIVFYERIPETFSLIFSEALSPRAAAGGALGIILSPALRQGIVKGLFSNEAGCGTAPAAHVASEEKVPARQGLFGVFEVFVDTILMCTLTAFVILLTLGEDAADIGGGGVAVCQNAFETVFGASAPFVLAVFVFLFAFSAIVSFGYYGLQSLAFLKAEKLGGLFLVAYCFSLFAGAVAAPSIVWTTADVVICLMLLINTSAVLVMRKKVVAEHEFLYVHMGKYSHKASRTRSRSASAVKNEIPMSESERNCGSIR